MSASSPPPDWEDQTDRDHVRAISTRYHGRMDTFDLTPETRAQLAFDLGVLIGLCERLLHERDEQQHDAAADNGGVGLQAHLAAQLRGVTAARHAAQRAFDPAHCECRTCGHLAKHHSGARCRKHGCGCGGWS